MDHVTSHVLRICVFASINPVTIYVDRLRQICNHAPTTTT